PRLFLLAMTSSIFSGCANGPAPAPRPVAFPPAAELPAQTTLPDPLVMMNGRRVTSRDQWFKERRPELQALFQHYMYGNIPPRPTSARIEPVGEYKDFLGGKATLKLV